MLEINGFSIKEIADLVNEFGIENAQEIISKKIIIEEDIELDNIEKILILEKDKNDF